MSMTARFLAILLVATSAIMLLGACGGGGGEGAPRATVSGRVIDAADGGGIDDATVALGDAEAVTDAAGDFAFPRAMPGPTSLSVTCEGYVQPGAPLSVDIAAGENTLDPVVMVPATELPPTVPPEL